MAVYSPTLMLQNYQDQSLTIFLLSFIFILAKAIVAILFLGATVIGYMKRDLNLFERVFCLIIACFLITALPITDEIAGILIVIYFVMNWLKTKKNKLI